MVLLGPQLWFPDPADEDTWIEDGMVAVGGDLSVPRLRLAYRMGLFPWTASPITWWCPDPRGIFELDEFHVSRSLARTLKKGIFQFTVDQAFEQVILGCATQPRPGGWISPEFIRAYTQLHRAGDAHSVECWQEARLVGGVYGVASGGCFSGESMFHRAGDASKAALYYLIQRLKERGFELFDIQMVTPITRRLGAREIPREDYLDRLNRAAELKRRFYP